MELLLAITAGTLYGAGFYLMLRRHLAQLIVGLGLLSNGTNLLIFTGGGLTRGRAPIIPEGQTTCDFSPFFIFCSASRQHGTTPRSGNSAGSFRWIELSKMVPSMSLPS